MKDTLESNVSTTPKGTTALDTTDVKQLTPPRWFNIISLKLKERYFGEYSIGRFKDLEVITAETNMFDDLKNWLIDSPCKTSTPSFLNDKLILEFITTIEKRHPFQRLNDKLLYSMIRYLSTADDKEISGLLEEESRMNNHLRTEGKESPIPFEPRLLVGLFLFNRPIITDLLLSKLRLIPSREAFKQVTTNEPPQSLKKIWDERETATIPYQNPQDIHTIVKLQRRYRHVQRQRLVALHLCATYPSRANFNWIQTLMKHEAQATQDLTPVSIINKVQALLRSRERPYTPRPPKGDLHDISARLKRIVLERTRVLYATVTHVTRKAIIPSLLDTLMLGAMTITRSLIEYQSAALNLCDIANGDGNVVCLGFDKIDWNAYQKGNVKLVFDLQMLVDSGNPTLFFKQHDLGYSASSDERAWAEVDVGAKVLAFNHIKTHMIDEEVFSCFMSISFDEYDIKCRLPSFTLISQNLSCLDAILTLNFFRYLDHAVEASKQKQEVPVHEAVYNIYSHLSRLNDDELTQFLDDVGRKLSRTGEFNLYGAHKIDMATLKEYHYIKAGTTDSSQKWIIPQNSGMVPAFIASNPPTELMESSALKAHIASFTVKPGL